MKIKDIILSTFLVIGLSLLLLFTCSFDVTYGKPNNVYEVFLDGKSIGLLLSKDEFLKIIDNRQQEIKNKFNVEKVYPPNSLNLIETTTYSENIKSANEIYDIISTSSPFTIEGYIITIRYPEDQEKDDISIQVLNEEDFSSAFYDTVAAFVGKDQLKNYKENIQREITDVGTKIESVYWDEEITVKKAYISTDKPIFTNSDDISKYLLFGTLDEQKKYIVKDGDSIMNIVNNNQLSVGEFLIANPGIPNENILLTPNQEVNIGLISPLVTIVNENKIIEDIVNKFKTEYKEDDTMYTGQTKVLQEGSNGLSRVTEQILYKNGVVENLVITNTSEITPTVNKIIAKGTKGYNSGSYVYINTGNDTWYWPTTSPYVITSEFAYRWGTHHNGIDISGSGFGSPIRSSTDAVVLDIVNTCPNHGYGYGDSCGGGYGNHVKVSVNDGEYTIFYAHLTNKVLVKVGDTINRGQIIGYMGDSGSSTGTHLHYEIRNSSNTPINPCTVFSC